MEPFLAVEALYPILIRSVSEELIATLLMEPFLAAEALYPILIRLVNEELMLHTIP